MTIFEYIKKLDERQFASFYEYLKVKCINCPFLSKCKSSVASCEEILPDLLKEDFEAYARQVPFLYEDMQIGYKEGD